MCNEDADQCEAEPVADGTSCDDDLFCTVADVCSNGTCTGPARDCSAAGDQCNDGVCNEDADQCEAQPVADGTPCPDEFFCNGEETCQAGQCTEGEDPCAEQGLGCDETTDQCVPPPTIVHIHQDNGAVRDGADNINPDGPASIQARTKGITLCKIQFSEDVNIGREDVEIRDVDNTMDLPWPTTFDYEPATYTLTMTWPDGTFEDQWVRIHVLDSVTSVVSGAALDGEICVGTCTQRSALSVGQRPDPIRVSAVSPAGAFRRRQVIGQAGLVGDGFVSVSELALDGDLPSGDGMAGGPAMFVLGSLIGDVTGNRMVNVTDRGIVQQHIGEVCPEGDLPSDITGNCIINVTDRGWVQQRIGNTLPDLPSP